MSDDIVRTAPLDDARSLVFADSATYLVDHTSGDWAISTLREMFVPFATYRLSDTDLIARVDRVGSTCRVSTFANTGGVFGDAPLAQVNVPCGEGALPTGFGRSILWRETNTGVTISADGTAINVLAAADVATMLAKIPQQQYGYIADGAKGGASIDFLDAAPASLRCASTTP